MSEETQFVASSITDEELEYIGLERCVQCQHLRSLHNSHCCEFCMVCDNLIQREREQSMKDQGLTWLETIGMGTRRECEYS